MSFSQTTVLQGGWLLLVANGMVLLKLSIPYFLFKYERACSILVLIYTLLLSLPPVVGGMPWIMSVSGWLFFSSGLGLEGICSSMLKEPSNTLEVCLAGGEWKAEFY